MNLPVFSAHSYAAFIHRYAGRILIALGLITLLVLPAALRLGLKANLIDLLPEDMPSVRRLNELTGVVGGTSYLIAVLESPDEETARQAAAELTTHAKSFEEVDEVDNRTDLAAFQDRKLLFLSLKGIDQLHDYVEDLIGYHRRKNNPFYIDLLGEKEPELDPESLELDRKIYRVGGLAGKEAGSFMRVVLIKPKHPVSDFEVSERLFEKVRKIFTAFHARASHPVTLGFTGPYKTRYDEYHVILQDLVKTGILTVVLIVGLMMLFFRNARSMIIAFLSLLMGLVWTAAFTELTISYLNLITAFLLAILFGLGISFAIHLLMRFEEERRMSGMTLQALERTYADITQPLVTSALTTSIAFFSLTISRFYGFKHFGLIAGVGIMLCFFSIYVGLPCLVVVTDRIPRIGGTVLSLESLKAEPKRGPILAVLAAGFLFSAYSFFNLTNVHFEYDFANLQQKDAESIVYANRIGKHFGVVLNPVALMTRTRAESRALAEKINDYIETHPESSFDFAASVEMHVPRDQKEKIFRMREIEKAFADREELIEKLDGEKRKKVDDLRRQLAATPFRFEDLPDGVIRQYEGTDGKLSVTYVYPKSSLLDGRMAKRFVRELRALKLRGDAAVAGEPVIYADILMLLERDTVWAMLISLSVVILLLFLHFKRPKDVAWVLAPVVTAFLWLIGMTAVSGFKFNYLNVTILPSILGVGIDSGIHIFHRYKKEGHSTFFLIMRKTGLAVILSLLTTMAAFLSLYLARHRGMSSLGELGFIGFAACLLTSVFFIPALIEFFELRYWRPSAPPRKPEASRVL